MPHCSMMHVSIQHNNNTQNNYKTQANITQPGPGLPWAWPQGLMLAYAFICFCVFLRCWMLTTSNKLNKAYLGTIIQHVYLITEGDTACRSNVPIFVITAYRWPLVYIYIYIYRTLGGVRSPLGRPTVTGKSFRVVRACARWGCQVEMSPNRPTHPFPFPFGPGILSLFPL